MKKIISFICAFVLLLGLTVPALAADFTDVPTGAWYAEDVAWCREHGIMSGTGSATFSPNTFMSRAMLAAVLYRAAGSPAVTGQADFSDVPAGAYYPKRCAPDGYVCPGGYVGPLHHAGIH